MLIPHRTLLALTTTLVTLLGCDQATTETAKPIEPAMHVDELVAHFKSIRMTEEEVQHAVSHAAAAERAIVFVHVGWAPMREETFAQFVLDYHQDHRDDKLAVHYIDVTDVFGDYPPLRTLTGWNDLERARGSRLIQGWGEIVWLKQGRVLHVDNIWNFRTPADLVNRTEALLPRGHELRP